MYFITILIKLNLNYINISSIYKYAYILLSILIQIIFE